MRYVRLPLIATMEGSTGMARTLCLPKAISAEKQLENRLGDYKNIENAKKRLTEISGSKPFYLIG